MLTCDGERCSESDSPGGRLRRNKGIDTATAEIRATTVNNTRQDLPLRKRQDCCIGARASLDQTRETLKPSRRCTAGWGAASRRTSPGRDACPMSTGIKAVVTSSSMARTEPRPGSPSVGNNGIAVASSSAKHKLVCKGHCSSPSETIFSNSSILPRASGVTLLNRKPPYFLVLSVHTTSPDAWLDWFCSKKEMASDWWC